MNKTVYTIQCILWIIEVDNQIIKKKKMLVVIVLSLNNFLGLPFAVRKLLQDGSLSLIMGYFRRVN